MRRPKLSICIATYNRANYLKKTLEHVIAFGSLPFDYEIIVSDNCSPDDTSSIVAGLIKKCDRIRYAKQTLNVGPENNLISAFRLAAGEFLVFLADDDMLIPDAVVATVQYMEQTPHVVACYAPCEFWDNATKQSLGFSYRIDKDTLFGKKDSIELFNTVVKNHIFPESGIYRSSPLHKLLYQPHRAYWAFVYMARLLAYGDIVFRPTSFYRWVTAHWEGETRNHFGNQQAKWEMELYRGGLEYLASEAFRNTGHSVVPPDQRHAVQTMINDFIAVRRYLALKLSVAEKDFISANELYARLLSFGQIFIDDVSAGSRPRKFLAAAQSLIETAESIAGINAIHLYDVSDPVRVAGLLKEVKEDVPVNLLSDDMINENKDWSKTFVLVGTDKAREKLIKAGFKGGLVIVEYELCSQFMQ